jgi:B-box zinc finger/Zinc finger, C3HC4 type (RING finger)
MDSSELCCAICEENYEPGTRDPLMLPCGHTYCSKCLKNLIMSSTLFCPEDRQPINISSVSDLPKNFSLLRMLNKNSGKQDNNSCKDHKKSLEFICLLDKAKVCANCALFGKHRGHEIKPIDEIVNDIASKAECLMEMLQLIEQSQKIVMGDEIKLRMDKLYERYCYKKILLEAEIREGFSLLRKKLTEMERDALETMTNNHKIIEDHLVNIRDVPKLIDSSATDWKNKVKQKLHKIDMLADDLNFDNFDILEGGCTDLFQGGEKILVELEGLKDIRIEPYEDMINSLSVEFKKVLPSNLCKINFVNKSFSVSEEAIPEVEIPSNIFNEKVFNQALDVLKFKTSNEADFSGAGDLGDLASRIAAYLPDNSYLTKLKLVKNNISDAAAIEIFRALQENYALQVLNLSQNTLSSSSLDELIEMLGINTTLQDIYLLGNPKLTPEYKAKFTSMASRFRRIHT